MVVTNKSIFTGKQLKEEIVKKTRMAHLPRTISFCLLFLFCIYFIISANDKTSLVVGIILLVVDLACFVFQIIQQIRIPKFVSEKNEYVNCDEIIYNYTFKEQSFIVELCANGKK
jgi:hypothetical protein